MGSWACLCMKRRWLQTTLALFVVNSIKLHLTALYARFESVDKGLLFMVDGWKSELSKIQWLKFRLFDGWWLNFSDDRSKHKCQEMQMSTPVFKGTNWYSYCPAGFWPRGQNLRRYHCSPRVNRRSTYGMNIQSILPGEISGWLKWACK